jgi:hypothetical protein
LNSPVDVITAYRDKGLLIDTNVLLLFFVGLHNRESIQRFKRTVHFTPDDFDCLAGVIQLFKRVVTTPSVLTEVSNFLGELGEAVRFSVFQGFSLGIQRFQEDFTPSRELAQERCFPKFGLTDTGILRSAKGKFLVLTDDFKLAGYLERQGIDVLNFNHLRMTYLLGQ